jgi:hypothetical protein
MMLQADSHVIIQTSQTAYHVTGDVTEGRSHGKSGRCRLYASLNHIWLRRPQSHELFPFSFLPAPKTYQHSNATTSQLATFASLSAKKKKMAPPRVAKHAISANEETISPQPTKRKRPIESPTSDAPHTTSVRKQRARWGKYKSYVFPKLSDRWQRWEYPVNYHWWAVEVEQGHEAHHDSLSSASSDVEVLNDDNDVIEVAQSTPINGTSIPTARSKGNDSLIARPTRIVLEISPDQLARFPHQRRRQQSSSDHAVLGLEAFLDELNEDDADEARAIFEPIRRNLEKGRDNKRHIDWLIRLFAPAKQRLQKLDEEYAGMSREITRKMERVSQSLQLLDDLDMVTDSVDVNE